MNLGKAIKSIRVEKGFKAKDLAVKISVRPEFVSKIENNDKMPSWVTLAEIAKQLDVSVELILLKAICAEDFSGATKSELILIAYFCT